MCTRDLRLVSLTGGFCFAYNADLFYRDIFPGYDLGWSLFVVTFLVGSVGVVVGGITSDSIVKKYGIRSRVAVLAISQVRISGQKPEKSIGSSIITFESDVIEQNKIIW